MFTLSWRIVYMLPQKYITTEAHTLLYKCIVISTPSNTGMFHVYIIHYTYMYFAPVVYQPAASFICCITWKITIHLIVSESIGQRTGWRHKRVCLWSTVVLIKILPYSGATAQTRSAALWGVSGSYGQAPAQQGMSGLVRETSHLWLYSSPSPSLRPILRESATSIPIVLYTFECIMGVATESLWNMYRNK